MRAIFYVGKREKLIAQPENMSIAVNAPAFDGRFAGTGEKRALKIASRVSPTETCSSLPSTTNASVAISVE